MEMQMVCQLEILQTVFTLSKRKHSAISSQCHSKLSATAYFLDSQAAKTINSLCACVQNKVSILMSDLPSHSVNDI